MGVGFAGERRLPRKAQPTANMHAMKRIATTPMPMMTVVEKSSSGAPPRLLAATGDGASVGRVDGRDVVGADVGRGEGRDVGGRRVQGVEVSGAPPPIKFPKKQLRLFRLCRYVLSFCGN